MGSTSTQASSRPVLADQADGGFRIVEGNGDDIGQHIVRRALGVGDRDRRVAAPGFRCRIEAHLGIVIGAVIGTLAFGDLWTAGMRPRRLQRHHHGLGAGIGKPHLFDRGQARNQQFSEIDFGCGRQAERRAQRELRGRRLDQARMRVAVNLRGEIVDAVDVDVAVEIPDPAALAARGVDRIGLHEHRGAGVAAGQARQRAVVHFLRGGIRIRVHAASENGGASPYSRWISARKPIGLSRLSCEVRKRPRPRAHDYVYRIARKNHHLRGNRTRRHASPRHARCLQCIRTRTRKVATMLQFLKPGLGAAIFGMRLLVAFAAPPLVFAHEAHPPAQTGCDFG